MSHPSTTAPTPGDDDLSRLQEWKRGWPVVLAASVGYGTGGAMAIMTAGMFMAPLRESLGWSTSAVTYGPIITLVMAATLPFAGILIDRIGSRRAALGGLMALAMVFALLAVVPISKFTLYGAAALMGFFGAFTVVPTYTRAVSSWFKKGIGLALGVTLSGSAFVAVGAFPVVGWAMATYGWRGGFVALAAIALGVGLPIIFFGYRERGGFVARPSQAERDAVPGATVREALKDARFWSYLTVFTTACIPLGGFVAHIQPLLTSQGFELPVVIGLGVMFAWSISAGRIVGGFFLDRIWPFAVASTVLFLTAVAALILPSVTPSWPFVVAAIVACGIGIGQGAEADFLVYFGVRAFGMKSYSTIIGIIAMSTTVAISIGAIGASRLYDLHQNYVVAGQLGAGLLVAASLLLLVTGLLERRGRSQAKPV